MDNYEKLREILDSHPSGAPKSKAFDEILRTLFTPKEVEIAIHMTFAPKGVEEIAQAAGLSPEEAEKRLEAMADKVIIFSREKDGKRGYGLVPSIPGLFEFPFMRGGGTPVHERLGRLWEEYHKDGMGASFAGKPTPLARVIPVEDSLNIETKAHPYEEVSRLIEETDFIALAECACRASVGACDAPRDTCLIFGGSSAPLHAKFLVERGYARKISKEQAYDVLKRSEDAGLIHTSNNSADKATFICNCCPCCCTVLRGRTQLNLPHAFATSSYIAQIKDEDCTGCGICADQRCHMGAIDIKDDIASIIPERCIGCGLCVSECPAEAISLVERTDKPEIPSTGRELGIKVLTEKQKMERFLDIMKR
ncbi:MAG: 4Fe-4S binding protein [Deltaproteobacteria bacterium]|nr:4Fe-4S binding protein [Deltaproteobacteria bacterium]